MWAAIVARAMLARAGCQRACARAIGLAGWLVGVHVARVASHLVHMGACWLGLAVLARAG